MNDINKTSNHVNNETYSISTFIAVIFLCYLAVPGSFLLYSIASALFNK